LSIQTHSENYEAGRYKGIFVQPCDADNCVCALNDICLSNHVTGTTALTHWMILTCILYPIPRLRQRHNSLAYSEITVGGSLNGSVSLQSGPWRTNGLTRRPMCCKLVDTVPILHISRFGNRHAASPPYPCQPTDWILHSIWFVNRQ